MKNLFPRITLRRLALVLAVLPAGCASVPSGGPTSSELLNTSESAQAQQVEYEVFDINEDVVRIAGAPVNDSFAGRFGGRGAAAAPVVGVGDVLSISVFESALGGLFTPPEASIGASAKNVSLPSVSVDNAGYIRIPFADRVHAAGRTTREIEKAIEERLKGRAIDPQVIVSLGTNRSSMVTVSGDVKAPSRFPIGVANERLLDVLAQAGGSANPPHESVVKLVRGNQSASVNLKTVFDDPRENVYVRPGDTVLVQRVTRAIVVLGAASKNAEIRFENDRMSLSAALGQAGGLQDTRADPTGVYVFRFERADNVRRMRPGWVDARQRTLIPTIYKLDLRAAGGYFLAQGFQMRNQDLLFVANSDGTQLLKMFQLVGTALGSTSAAASVSKL